MGAVFLRIVNMSITASWLIVAVILVRLLLKKAPATGQGWFTIFRNNAETLAKQYSREDLEKYYPASFLFLQMSDSNFEIKE